MIDTGLNENINLHQVIDLGSELLKADNLVTQQKLIKSALKKMFGGKVEVWLSDILLKLPGKSSWSPTSLEPSSNPMKEALKTGQIVIRKNPRQLVALPIFAQQTLIGAIQISRPINEPFSSSEFDNLKVAISYTGQSITISHRREVEQWRMEQLNLVHKVSSQIVDILDLDELINQVTQLIRKTFDYYYVSIFTLTPTGKMLNFRSSAGGADKQKE